MTCKTCHGQKVIRRAEVDPTVPVATFISDRAPRPRSRLVEVPCPDCTPRPFAEVLRGASPETHDLFVAGRFLCSEPTYDTMGEGPVLPTVAGHINAAVEKREAKLRGRNHAVRMIAAELGDAGRHLIAGFQGRERMVAAIKAFSEHMLEVVDDEDEHVPGDVACGLAFDLGAEQEKTRGAWQVLFEAMLEAGGEGGAMVANVLGRKLGLLPENVAWASRSNAESLTDEQLEAEVKRRDALERIVHVFAEHEYGFAEGHHTVTGRSLCGMSLDVGGRWTAITRNDFNSGSGASCPACLRAAALHDAALAMVEPA